jgi:hypothetical protein
VIVSRVLGACAAETGWGVEGGSPAPTSLVGAATDSKPGDLGWWVGDGLVNGSTLQVFYHHYKSGGAGALNYVSLGAGIATFALPSLTLQSLVPLDTNPQIQWGNAVVDGRDGYTYIYGIESANSTSYLHIARAPNGSVLGAAGSPSAAWTYWTDNPKSAQYPVHNRTSFTLAGLKAGTSYQFYVTAVGDADNESAGSNVVSAVATLAAPTGVTATVDGYGMVTVTVKWSPPFASALYQIYQHDDDADPGHDKPYTHLICPAPSSSGSNGVLVGSLTADHTYSFYVTTAYAGNESKPSNVVSPNRKVSAPTGMRGSTVASSSGSGQCESGNGPDCHVHLSWNAVTGAAHYDVYRLLVSADETSYRYIGSSNSATFDMPVGALAHRAERLRGTHADLHLADRHTAAERHPRLLHGGGDAHPHLLRAGERRRPAGPDDLALRAVQRLTFAGTKPVRSVERVVPLRDPAGFAGFRVPALTGIHQASPGRRELLGIFY